MKLPENHVNVLETVAEATEPMTIETVAITLDIKPETATGAAFGLAEAGFIDIDEEQNAIVSLSEEGRQYAEKGLPEQRLLTAARELDEAGESLSLGEVIQRSSLSGEEIDIALANFSRKGYGQIEQGTLTIDDPDPADEEEAAIATLVNGEATSLDEAVIDSLERRNLVTRTEQIVRTISISETGEELLDSGVTVEETVSEVTPTLLTSQDWESADFRSYNVRADAPVVHGGSEHVLRQTAERVKEVLVGMGFKEMDGPHIDADFWINDCLFMPQDHPARTHWDRFALDQPTYIDELPAELAERVEQAHREGVGDDGEGYHSPWDESFARALALRGHTTSLSARHLAGVASSELEPPQRFFSVEKAYRNDTIDATHLLEFFQIEGWVMADALSVRDLMGTFTEFYAQFGITDLQFKPHYNPYTEPSFELFGTHPRTGELIEIGNSGIFRPEMLEPLGVDCDVMAWGLALERLMMLVTGAEDIRDVHGTLVDLEFLRTERVVY